MDSPAFSTFPLVSAAMAVPLAVAAVPSAAAAMLYDIPKAFGTVMVASIMVSVMFSTITMTSVASS